MHSTMASADRLDQPAEVARKVLRRAKVSKMAFALQNRLALANVKIKHGWENLSLDSIEPKVERELKRRRTNSSNHGSVSEASSSTSEHFHALGFLDSSPLAPPIFSDDIHSSASIGGYAKRTRYQPQQHQSLRYPASSSHSRTRVRTSSGSASTWKSAYSLPQSSPIHRRTRQRSRYPASLSQTLSFVSETSTVPDDPPSPLHSEDDDQDLPLHSFQIDSAQFQSSPPQQSPPRTPSPDVARSARLLRDKAFKPQTRDGQAGDDSGADLLLYLAASPSPAGGNKNNSTSDGVKARIFAPSTPPPKATPLPSSMMSTPGGGGGGLIGFGPNTPSAGFNFADFVNITPSPAQGPWSRTPAAAKPPLAAREARRRLNFDSLMPPSGGSPGLGGLERPTGKETGLGMELGGELVS